MQKPWFTTWGQVIQVMAAVVGCIFAGIKAWPDMKTNQLLSLGSLLFYILVGLVVVSVTLLIRAMTRRGNAALPSETEKPIETVYTLDFKYLPKSPLENGWIQSYNVDGVAEYGSDPEIPGSLRMKILKSEVAIHHDLPPHATLADHLEFTAKYTGTTMIFARLIVGTGDGSTQRNVDIKFHFGNLHVVPTSPNPNPGRDANKWLPEQTIYLPARVLSGGRLAFNIDLRDAVNLSLGNQGWVFKSIQGVRLRSNLSISPLVFGKAT
jgi:hypothetical protein